LFGKDMSIEQQAHYLLYGSLIVVVAGTISGALWAGRDAARRDKSPLLVFLLVFFLQFPFGLIAWLVFRPAVPAKGTTARTADDPDAELKRRANAGQL
jgi:hypothetical protein